MKKVSTIPDLTQFENSTNFPFSRFLSKMLETKNDIVGPRESGI